MPCLCSLQLASLLDALPQIPTLTGLVPPLSVDLVAALNPLGTVAPASLTASGMAAASASAQAAANLAVMASLAADVRAAMGVNLMASLSGTAQANLQASLAQTMGSLNVNASPLNPLRDLLQRLLNELANLMRLASVVSAARASLGIDLRAPGAMAALQAHLAATVSARASATATAQVSAQESLMVMLGVPLTAAGVASMAASMQATADMAQALPGLSVDPGLLSLLNALLALLAAIKNALGTDLLAANAWVSLRASLGGLPVAALATLQVQALASATASATAQATAAATAALDVSPLAAVNLSATASLAATMRLAAQFNGLLMPAGRCGKPCPVAALSGGLPAPTATLTVSGA